MSSSNKIESRPEDNLLFGYFNYCLRGDRPLTWIVFFLVPPEGDIADKRPGCVIDLVVDLMFYSSELFISLYSV